VGNILLTDVPEMAGWALWWCQLFGYVDCKQPSTFEALVLAGMVWLAAYVALILTISIIGAIAGK
jgi:hypothetical protein